MARNTSVMGIYTDRATASDAVSVLQRAGYRATDICFLTADNQGSKDFAHERHNRAPEGAAVGAALGVAAGAAAGWFISIGTVAIPELAMLVAAGPVLAALAGAGAGGVAGWIAGFLAGMPLSLYVAKRYAGRIRSGGILLSVHCDSNEWIDRAKKALRDTGARNISVASESAADYGTTDRPTERAPIIVDRLAAPVQPLADSVFEEGCGRRA